MSLPISISYWNIPESRRAKRLFQMVHELHKIGYQGLRVSFGFSPSGAYYRIYIFPYTLIGKDNLNRWDFSSINYDVSHYDFSPLGIFNSQELQLIISEDPNIDIEKMIDTRIDSFTATYSSSEKNKYFGWVDGPDKNARQLANKFINCFPQICRLSFVEDWRYAGWFTRLLGMVENGYLPASYVDMMDISKSKGIYLSRQNEVAIDHVSDFDSFVYPPKPSIRANSSAKKRYAY